MSEWFRNTDWSPQIEKDFFQRLGRARSQKLEYLRIQAITLCEFQPRVSLALIERYLEINSGSSNEQAYETQAHAYISLGESESAAASFEKALYCHNIHPFFNTQIGFDFPLLVATCKMTKRYDRALQVIEDFQSGMIFPVNRLKKYAAQALILTELGRQEVASEFALMAIREADEQQSSFSRHSGIGLVGHEHNRLLEVLQALSGNNRNSGRDVGVNA